MSTRKAKTLNRKNRRLRKKMSMLFDKISVKDMIEAIALNRAAESLFPKTTYLPVFGPPITRDMLRDAILPSNPLPTEFARYGGYEEK